MTAPDTRPETRAEPVACDCWREAMNRYRHGRNVRAACSCGDHPSNKWCDCLFCSVVLAQPTQSEAVEALRERLLVLADLWEGRCPEDFGTPAECVNEVGDVLDACANDLRSALTTDEEGARMTSDTERKPVTITGLWIRRQGNDLVALVERDDEWHEIMRAAVDGEWEISHIVESSGLLRYVS